MNPKSYKDFIPKISQDSDLPLDLLRDLTDFYWGDIRSLVVSLEHPKVGVPHLGVFCIKGDQKINDEIAVQKRILSRLPKTLSGYTKTLAIQEKIYKLEDIRDKFLKEVSDKKEIRIKRYEIRKAKENNLPSQGDSIGDNQHPPQASSNNGFAESSNMPV